MTTKATARLTAMLVIKCASGRLKFIMTRRVKPVAILDLGDKSWPDGSVAQCLTVESDVFVTYVPFSSRILNPLPFTPFVLPT